MKPQFTIRDLLWLMVVAGVIVVWWLDKRATIEANRRNYSAPPTQENQP